ncbi:flagellar hook-basal body complex protein FliE [Desulfosporosinus sp. PR]|uniref:flagellar hook-basal body complex protein FliE n=1 Tax=Candidatus Desulfosporosinus nitrosoreducens TaxID=3401928 RepID=UPI0027FAA426|nr:flagellar hook-basal body complex protein FliE [Desulfosporosinus sp. PR]MDQ7096238.1 flagellar hook-basal body complex protein FliE [Desulfosporosinus sp. PR]
MSIQPIVPIVPLSALSPLTPANLESTPAASSGGGTQQAGADFSKFLQDALSQVNDLQTKADTASLQLATGQVQDLSSVMVALQKANLSLSMTVSVRDKVIDAYNQIMRMQL